MIVVIIANRVLLQILILAYYSKNVSLVYYTSYKGIVYKYIYKVNIIIQRFIFVVSYIEHQHYLTII